MRRGPCTPRTEASRSLASSGAEDQVTLGWLAVRLQAFVDLHPEFDVPVDRLATWLARADGEDDEP